MEIEHILGLRMFSIQGLACGLVPELHSQTKIELDSFILIQSPLTRKLPTHAGAALQ